MPWICVTFCVIILDEDQADSSRGNSMAHVPSEFEIHVSGSDFCGDLDDESRYYDSPGRRSQSSQHSMASGFEAVT